MKLETGSLPLTHTLVNAFPNPFNARLNVTFGVTKAGAVKVRLFDAAGRLAGTVWEGEASAGEHQLTFDAAGLSTGIYLLRFEAAGTTQTKKLIMMK